MRFCPFCSAENTDEQGVCAACGRRLPPLPPRRPRNAPPTGVQLPPRAPAAPSPRRAGPTQPPPVPVAPNNQSGVLPLPQPGVMVSPGAQHARPGSHAELGPAPARDSVPALPPPPLLEEMAGAGPAIPLPDEAAKRSLLNAITPGPAAQRREPESPDPDPHARARRVSDQWFDAPDTVPAAAPLQPQSPRAKTPAAGLPAPQPSGGRTSTTPPVAASTLPPRAKSPTAPPVPAPPPPRAKAPTKPPRSYVPPSAFGDDFHTVAEAKPFETGQSPLVVEEGTKRPHAEPWRGGGSVPGDTPPPTRIQRPEQHAERPFTPPKVSPIPELPEPGLYAAARYTVRFARARWQRRGAIRILQVEIRQDTEALDQVLGALGKVARTARVDGRVFSAENNAINTAEERVGVLGKEHADVDGRKAEENSRFVDVERERTTKVSEAERMVDEHAKELASLEGQRRSLRDKRKELERRQKAYLRAAEDNDKQAGGAQMGDSRAELRRAAEQHRREAAALEPDRQEVDRRLASIERPIAEATAKVDAAKAELDAAKRSLSDAREGHGHRLAELDAEQKRKAREIGMAEGEIARRLVTLGTLVNLNRIDDSTFSELYQRIDRLRGAITARTTETEKLMAEREAYDRGTIVRGVSAMGGVVVAFIALVVILRAVF